MPLVRVLSLASLMGRGLLRGRSPPPARGRIQAAIVPATRSRGVHPSGNSQFKDPEMSCFPEAFHRTRKPCPAVYTLHASGCRYQDSPVAVRRRASLRFLVGSRHDLVTRVRTVIQPFSRRPVGRPGQA